MKYDVRYVAIVAVRRTIEADSLGHAMVLARFARPTAVTLQERIARNEEQFRVEIVSPEPYVIESE